MPIEVLSSEGVLINILLIAIVALFKPVALKIKNVISGSVIRPIIEECQQNPEAGKDE